MPPQIPEGQIADLAVEATRLILIEGKGNDYLLEEALRGQPIPAFQEVDTALELRRLAEGL